MKIALITGIRKAGCINKTNGWGFWKGLRADHVFLNLSTQHRQLRDSNNEQIHDFSSALNYILTNKIKSLKLSTQADKTNINSAGSILTQSMIYW